MPIQLISGTYVKKNNSQYHWGLPQIVLPRKTAIQEPIPMWIDVALPNQKNA